MKSRVVAWNRKRGLLDNFDPQLEIKMLSEEVREFYQAEEYSHMLQEYADFLFVKEGTTAKFNSMVHPSAIMFANNNDSFKHLLVWIDRVEKDMYSTLKCEAKDWDRFNVDNDIEIAFGFVVSANQQKGTEKVDGKVVKGDAYLSPLQLIRNYMGGR